MPQGDVGFQGQPGPPGPQGIGEPGPPVRNSTRLTPRLLVVALKHLIEPSLSASLRLMMLLYTPVRLSTPP